MTRRSSRATVLACALLVFLGAGLAETGNLDKASRQVDRGFAAMDDGNPARARSCFEKALQYVPPFPEAHVGLGHLAVREKDYEKALEEYQAARSGYRELADQLFDIDSRRYLESRQTLQELEQELLRLPNADVGGSDQARKWRAEDLKQQIRQIESLQPPVRDEMAEAPARVDFYVGNALCRLKRWDEAVEAYETSLGKLPEFAEAHHNIALAYWRAGRIEDAVASLDRAEELGFEINPRFRADLQRAYRSRKAADTEGGGS